MKPLIGTLGVLGVGLAQTVTTILTYNNPNEVQLEAITVNAGQKNCMIFPAEIQAIRTELPAVKESGTLCLTPKEPGKSRLNVKVGETIFPFVVTANTGSSAINVLIRLPQAFADQLKLENQQSAKAVAPSTISTTATPIPQAQAPVAAPPPQVNPTPTASTPATPLPSTPQTPTAAGVPKGDVGQPQPPVVPVQETLESDQPGDIQDGPDNELQPVAPAPTKVLVSGKTWIAAKDGEVAALPKGVNFQAWLIPSQNKDEIVIGYILDNSRYNLNTLFAPSNRLSATLGGQKATGYINRRSTSQIVATVTPGSRDLGTIHLTRIGLGELLVTWEINDGSNALPLQIRWNLEAK